MVWMDSSTEFVARIYYFPTSSLDFSPRNFGSA